MFLLKQVKYFLADKNACAILCESLNKVYYYNYYNYYFLEHLQFRTQRLHGLGSV